MEVGKKYYVITHAYFHYVGEVTKINPRTVEFKNIVQVHGCNRNWTLFFRDGFENDTKFDVLPDGSGLTVTNYFPWLYDIPKVKSA